MQPEQNPFDPGRPFPDGGQRDTTGQPPPPPPPPSYQQHFQNVRFGTSTPNPLISMNPSATAGGPPSQFQQLNTIFGGTPNRPASSTSAPVFGGFGNPTTSMAGTVSMFGERSRQQDQRSSTVSDGAQLFQRFNVPVTAVQDSTSSRPAQMFTSGNFPHVPPIFPGGTSSPSKFKLVESRGRATTMSTSTGAAFETRPLFATSVSQPTPPTTTATTTKKNAFEKRFGFGTSPTNIFGAVGPRLNENKSRGRYNFKQLPQSPSSQESAEQSVDERTKSKPGHATVTSKSVVDNPREIKTTNRGHTNASSLKNSALRRSGSEAVHSTRYALAGSSGSVLRRSRLSSRDIESKHNESRTRRLSDRSRSSGNAGDLLRLQQDEIEQLMSIVLKRVPARLNNKRQLLHHFGKYGAIQKINCMVTKEMAIIHFTDHESARKAKENGSEMEPGKSQVLILWGRMATPSARPTRGLAAAIEKSSVKSAAERTASKEQKSVSTTVSVASSIIKDKGVADNDDDGDDDVKEELNAMRQHVDDLNAPMVLNRTRDVESSPFLSPKSTKQKQTRRTSPHPPPNVPPQDNTFQALSNRQAVTAGDKFQVLVARDKYLRQSLKKPSDLASAKAVVGTCPDMSPEKERYMREERGQLHPYEVLVGGDERSGEFPRVDHRKAIKEYSRSSADQEEPLPHELRPPIVLERTMDYLVCNIMDLLDTLEGPNAAAEWYDFVWNRTRAIRKDITQQHLCDQTSVALVEKCTRFHIQCAERLCEEDMSIFDQKINNENLTKCLQTLKHFYADLAVKGEPCLNECEFRAYDILLNLNEGDTLREVLCLQPHIRESNEVRFALRLFANVNSNNYVAFFKNVRRAPYLTACILQRYFIQVRERALKVTLKAYCAPNHSGQFPITKFVEMLAFENQVEAEEFLSYHSIAVELDYLVWDRACLSYPESAIPTRRACSLIESKRCCSVGEVVNGGPLPANPLDTHNPQCSFDQQGNLINLPDVDGGSHPSMTERSVATVAAIESSSSSDERKTQIFTLQLNKAIEDEASDIALGVLTIMTRSVCWSSLDELYFNVNVMNVASNLLTNVLEEIIRGVAAETLREFKSVELRLRKQREEDELERQRLGKEAAAEKALDDLLDKVVSFEARRLAANILREERDHEWQRCARLCSETISSEYVDGWMEQFITDISVEIHSFETEYRRSTLKRVSRKLDEWRARVFYHKWRKSASQRKRTRHSMETFPSSTIEHEDKRCMTEAWMPGRLQSPLQIASDQKLNNCLLDLGLHRRYLENRLKDTPLDLLCLAKNNILCLDTRGTYWKIAVLIPNGGTVSDHVFSTWLRQKLGCQSTRTHSNCSVELLNRTSSIFKGRVLGVCTKAFYGSFDSQESTISLLDDRELQGTRGVVMILPLPSSSATPFESYWAGEYRRLCTIIRCMPPQPAAPVLLLCPWRLLQSSSTVVEDGLHLESLVNDRHLISTYRIVEISGDMREQLATNHLIDGMDWLAEMCPPVPNLKLIDLDAFVDDCIKTFFSSVVYRIVRNNAHCSVHFHPPPDLLVAGYNHAINFAVKVASCSSLKDVSWPPKEFSSDSPGIKEHCMFHVDWNTEENLSAIRRRVELYRLPPFPHQVAACTTFDQITHMLWSYVDVVIPALAHAATSKSTKAVVATRIQRILDRSSELYDSKGSGLRPSDVIPWIDVVHAIVDHVFCCLAEVDMTVVVYDPKFARTFAVSKEWVSAVNEALAASENARANQTVLRQSNSTATPFLPTNAERESKDEQGLKRKLARDPFAEAPREKTVYMECQRLSSQLATEKLRNAEFDVYLEKVLKGGDKMLRKDQSPTNKPLIQ